MNKTIETKFVEQQLDWLKKNRGRHKVLFIGKLSEKERKVKIKEIEAETGRSVSWKFKHKKVWIYFEK